MLQTDTASATRPEPTQTSEPTKNCPACRRDRPLSAFAEGASRNLFGKQSYCRECNQRLQRDYARLRKAVPAKPANPVCPICERSGHAGFDMDHDHTTGKFRAYVCHGCNINMDRYTGDHPLAEATSRYLALHGSAH